MRLATLLLTIVSTTGMAAEQKIVCPPELPESAMQLVSPRPEWKPYVSSSLFLHDAAPIAGPPEKLGTMVGKLTRKSKTEWSEFYTLEGPFPDGKWFKCDYGVDNSLSLNKKLDDSVVACTVKSKKGEKFGQTVFDISCKS